jgi:hypothetical protein
MMKVLTYKVSLGALIVMALAAIAASGASAAGATAYTCVAGGSGFSNADCSTTGTGFHDVAIAVGESTAFSVKGTSTQTFSGELAGTEIELNATGVECVGCMIENKIVGGVMEAAGTAQLNYTGVTVGGGLGKDCKVEGGVILGHETIIHTTTTRILFFHKTSTTVFTVDFEPLAGKVCPIEGNYPIEGEINGTLSGANAFISTVEGELSLFGEPVILTGNMTISAGLTGGEQHPLVMTAS